MSLKEGRVSCYNRITMGARALSGFTLIELVIVLLIVGIVAAVTVTDLASSRARVALQGARLKLVGDLRYAQSLAVSRQLRHGIVFTPAQDRYAVYCINTTDIVTDPLSGKPLTVAYTADALYQGVDLVATAIGPGTSNQVEFDLWGKPYANATAALAANATVTLACDAETVTVTVTPETGKVR